MKIALLGYGKMGKEIEKIALERGHSISHKIDSEHPLISLENTDVAIDFSSPENATHHISHCLDNGIPIVSGTTGWLEQFEAMKDLCNNEKGAFIYASNFSLGVNLFFKLNEQLATLMKNHEDYKVAIEEIHHTEKKDAPSGTAITLAEEILTHGNLNSWHLTPEIKEHSLPITAKRIAEVKGTHTISYTSEIDTLSIKHEAFNRKGFALGAVIAAEWLLGKTGVFTMQDVLNIG